MDLHGETALAEAGARSDLWIRGGRFVTSPLAGVPTHAGGFAAPGPVDAHAHLVLASSLATEREAAQIRASARSHLDALVARHP